MSSALDKSVTAAEAPDELMCVITAALVALHHRVQHNLETATCSLLLVSLADVQTGGSSSSIYD